jgi:putative N6-adenine-specific DNA methylase
LQKVIKGGSVPLAPADAASATPSAGTPRNAPQNLYVSLIDDRCTLWLDLAGEELYKRGHERFVNDAPLKETIAAAMLFEAISTLRIIHHQSSIINYPLSITLIDPMSGSGTFSLEAAYMANGFIPGKCRDFALKHQPAFKQATWDFLIRRETRDERREKGNNILKIVTSDISERAVEIIQHNVECCPLAKSTTGGQSTTGNQAAPTITPQHRDFFSYTAAEIADACPEGSSPVIVLNPPYGKRLDFDAPKLYTKIGKKLAELARELSPLGKPLTVAILAPKDDPRPGTKYTCTANLLRECPTLDTAKNCDAKCIVTSHGGLSLNAIFAKI